MEKQGRPGSLHHVNDVRLMQGGDVEPTVGSAGVGSVHCPVD